MLLEYWALWGLLGAFVYAGPRLIIVFGDKSGKPMGVYVSQFLVALAIGPIFAAGFGPYAAAKIGLKVGPEWPAAALIIGIVANPAAPLVVKLLTWGAIQRLGGPPSLNGPEK